ncbi:unnamed protein product [Oikopleura dioica]|uniref:Uncharacterized protein n=1 Tax=Oikopleura dioica TaxID=34765 RepID=E4XWT0_OIKDI|nr:unnamed protein product [Oikopleura dioica]
MANHEAECSYCGSSGILRKCKGRIKLVVSEIQVPIFPKVSVFADHGNATKKQQAIYLIFGCLFWMSIILTTNTIGLEKLTAHITYKTSICNFEYKECVKNYEIFESCNNALSDCLETRQFTHPNVTILLAKETNETNIVIVENVFYDVIQQEINLKNCQKLRFYDRAICRNLCSLTDDCSRTACEKLCETLLSQFGFLEDICPFEKLCPVGCPCKFFPCTLTKVPQIQAARNHEFNSGRVVLYNWETKQQTQTNRIDSKSFLTSVKLKDQFFFISEEMQIFELDENNKFKSLEIDTSGFYRFRKFIAFQQRGMATGFEDHIFICRPEFDLQACFYVLPERRARLYEMKERVPATHSDISYLTVWDETLHIYSIRTFPIDSKSIEISSLESQKWNNLLIKPDSMFGKDVCAEVVAFPDSKSVLFALFIESYGGHLREDYALHLYRLKDSIYVHIGTHKFLNRHEVWKIAVFSFYGFRRLRTHESHWRLLISEVQESDMEEKDFKSMEIVIDGDNSNFDVVIHTHQYIQIMV